MFAYINKIIMARVFNIEKLTCSIVGNLRQNIDHVWVFGGFPWNGRLLKAFKKSVVSETELGYLYWKCVAPRVPLTANGDI